MSARRSVVSLLKRLALTLSFLAGTVVSSFAQPAPDGFEPVSQMPAVEHLPAAPLLIAAYAFIWLGMLAYVFMLWRRLAAVDRELASLRRSIERQD
jgi:CcmD family protein